jgi:GNAT superfamily N-acetyltransferase
VTGSGSDDLAARAREFHYAVHAAVCDVFEPWRHGTVVRATRYPDYFDLNVVRVEEHPAMSVEALAAFADEALDGLKHRRMDFEDADAAQALRPEFEALGWMTERLVWMRHEAPPPPGGREVAVEEVPYDAVRELRFDWHREDFPHLDPDGYLAAQSQVAEADARFGGRVLAVSDAGRPVGYAQVDYVGRGAVVAQVYVSADHRGRGLGTALTRAAIEAASDAEETWIIADDEGRPKRLYARLGFRPAWTAVEMLRA